MRNVSTASISLMFSLTIIVVLFRLIVAEVPLYIPADLPCSDLWSHHLELRASGGGDSESWEEAGDMCNITYRGVAVSTPEGRTTVSYETSFRVHKELLSQVLNTVLRVRERDARQVGDPFITPYLAGVYQRLGLEYSGLLCFTRLTLLWRRMAAARAACTAAAAAQAAQAAADAREVPTGPWHSEGQGPDEAAAAGTATGAGAGARPPPPPPLSRASPSPPPPPRPAARVVPMDWHVQQLHRELVLEPWKAADLRLMLGRTACFAEGQLASGAASCSAGADSAAGGGAAAAAAAAAGAAGIPGPWLPRHASALLGGGVRVGSYGGGGGGCEGSAGATVFGGPGGPFEALLFWALWLLCPTMLVALEALQAAPDNPWMALYICVVATCRTIAEWRATAAVLLARGQTPTQRLYGVAATHLLSGLASAVLTGLLNTWLPLLGHGAAAAVVWLHLLLLPAVMVGVMTLAGMPKMVRQIASAGRMSGGGGDGANRRVGGRDRRAAAAAHLAGGIGGGGAGTDPSAGPPARRAPRDGDRGGHGNGVGGGGGGGGERGRSSGAAAAAALVHWPPALDVPAWLDDWPNAPEAFRCPITQSLMREPAQASSGVTYERPAIMQWLDYRRVDPVTHVPLKRHRLAPNLNLRHMIEVWVQDRVEARRRLAQRLRDEFSAVALAEAEAATAAEGKCDASDGDGTCSGSATTVEAAAPPPPGPAGAAPAREDGGQSVLQAAITGSMVGATRPPGNSGPVEAADGGASAAVAVTSEAAVAAGVRAVGSVELADSAPVATLGARGAGDGGGGGDGGRGDDGDVVGPAAWEVRARRGAGMPVEEVEAMAAAAARARLACRRHWPSHELAAAGRRGGAAAIAVEYDNSYLGADDGDASTPVSVESPFAAPVAHGDSSGDEAETEMETAAGADGAAGGSAAGATAGPNFSGLRRRWRRRAHFSSGGDAAADSGGAGSRGTVAGAAAAATAAAAHGRGGGGGGGGGTELARPGGTGALSGLGREPSWGLMWDGADPDSSGVLAVDGSIASTATATAAGYIPAASHATAVSHGAGAGAGTGGAGRHTDSAAGAADAAARDRFGWRDPWVGSHQPATRHQQPDQHPEPQQRHARWRDQQ